MAKHEVFWDNLVLHAREGHVVQLGSQSFSCGKWGKIGIPCQHALATLAFEGSDLLVMLPIGFTRRYISRLINSLLIH